MKRGSRRHPGQGLLFGEPCPCSPELGPGLAWPADNKGAARCGAPTRSDGPARRICDVGHDYHVGTRINRDVRIVYCVEEADMDERIAALDKLRAENASAEDAPIFADWMQRLETVRRLHPEQLQTEADAIAAEADAHADLARDDERAAVAALAKLRKPRLVKAAVPDDAAPESRPNREQLTIAAVESPPPSIEAARRRNSLFVRVVLALQFGAVD